MPKIVDKLQKRKTIAKSTCGLFVEKGFVNISINEIAKVAGIGKGTVYEYFSNKEDIVFELMSCLQDDYDIHLKQNLLNSTTVQEQVISLFDIFINDSEKVKIQRQIYKEFLAIYLNNPTDEIIQYHANLKEKYYLILSDILKKSISHKDISQDALKFIPSLLATVEGFFIVNEKKELILEYIENLFKLLIIKGDKK